MAMRVRDLMATEVVSIQPGELTGHALDLMRVHGISHLVVQEEGGAVAGILSDRDLRLVTNVTASARASELSELHVYNVPVSTIMTHAPVQVTPDTSLSKAARLLVEGRFHCLVVVNRKQQLVGILTEGDILQAVADKRLE